ncbi:MAG TPA: type II toxin-antitoxin system Phd/YefM family antitoxin [Thermococcus sp.]|nr:type II toxin-antitoxin system Phd/YefM family antitoxin [Thermococcus sp.]
MTIGGSHMNTERVTIAQGKRGFTSIVREVVESDKDFIVTKRGKPVAVLLPYGQYKEIKRIRNYLKMLEISEKLKDRDITASEIYEQSRGELERNGHSY